MFDYLIKNGQLIDGTGSPARRADVGITDGKIAAIGELSAAQARMVPLPASMAAWMGLGCLRAASR